MVELLFACSTLFTIVAYAYYAYGLMNKKTTPNRWSWLIWSLATAVEALTYGEVSGDPIKYWLFFVSAGCCVVITVLIWTRSTWQMPDWSETACVLFSVIAIVIWKEYGSAKWAHYVSLAAMPVGFIPTYHSAWLDYRHENSPAWRLWTIGDFLALCLIISTLNKSEELPYSIVEFICHAIVWYIVAVRSRSAYLPR